MDNQTGGYRGFVGGRNYPENQNNHAIDQAFQPQNNLYWPMVSLLTRFDGKCKYLVISYQLYEIEPHHVCQ